MFGFFSPYGKFFTREELACKCGCGMEMEWSTVRKLNKARKIAELPFVVTSGCKCLRLNKAIGGSPTSSHKLGIAVDLAAMNSKSRYIIVAALMQAGFLRIGIDFKRNFIHADGGMNKTWPALFGY